MKANEPRNIKDNRPKGVVKTKRVWEVQRVWY